MATQNNLVGLSGAFEFMMDDFMEWLLEDRDAGPSLQIILD